MIGKGLRTWYLQKWKVKDLMFEGFHEMDPLPSEWNGCLFYMLCLNYFEV